MHKYQEKETTWYSIPMLVVKLTVLCELILIMTFILHFRPVCEDVFELQDDIAHSEAQDSLMCSAGRIPFACYQQNYLVL